MAYTYGYSNEDGESTRVFGTEQTARTSPRGGGHTGCLGNPKRHVRGKGGVQR